MKPRMSASETCGSRIVFSMWASFGASHTTSRITRRSPSLAAGATTGEGKASQCLIKLSPDVIRTAPQARRPFQGWRYLEPKDAPLDLSSMDAGDLPVDLAKQLRELGAW